MAILYKTDGTELEVKPKGRYFSNAELRELIGCDGLDFRTIRAGIHLKYFISDDESKLRSGGQVNEKATRIYCPDVNAFYQQVEEMKKQGFTIMGGDEDEYKLHEIVGNVIVCSLNELESDEY